MKKNTHILRTTLFCRFLTHTNNSDGALEMVECLATQVLTSRDVLGTTPEVFLACAAPHLHGLEARLASEGPRRLLKTVRLLF